jgi:hypothetical protein
MEANSRKKKVIITQILLISITLSLFIGTIIKTENPKDYRPDKLAILDRKGTINGYTFLPWEEIMPNSSLANEYMDLAAKSLNCCYINTQWQYVGLDNDTLDLNYLGNLSLFIKGMAQRNVSVLIYTWVSSYSPKWMYYYTPELKGKSECWFGIDPKSQNSTSIDHRNSLKWSMVRYYEMLCDYFINNSLADNIIGFNLDDETNGQNWNDFFKVITDVIHSKKVSWDVQAMWYTLDTYKIAGEVGFDVNGLDSYTQDLELIQRIEYSYQNSGVEKVSVILSAMFEHDVQQDMDRLRRLFWISWFMGADQIGYYSYYYGDPKWSCAIVGYDEKLGPITTDKTRNTFEIAKDISLLNQAYDKLNLTTNIELYSNMEVKLLKAYSLAKASQFNKARDLIYEVLNQ